MIKNEIYIPTIATERNDFIQAIERNDVVIYVSGKIYNDIMSEIRSSKKIHKFFDSSGNLIIAVAVICIFTAGIGFILTSLIVGALNKFIGSLTEFKNYKFGIDVNDGEERIVLLHKKYDYQYHSISDGCIIVNSRKCSKCGNKWDKKTSFCNTCKAHIIVVK